MKSINMFSYIGERYHPNESLVKTNDLSRNKPDGFHEKEKEMKRKQIIYKYINEGHKGN